VNVVCLIGRLGKDPELRVTQGGTSVAKFSLAVDRRDEAKNTDWFDVTCFGKVAESTGQYMKKGCMVGVPGRLQQDRWPDKQTGQNRSKVAVIATQVDFLSRAGENAQQEAQNTQQEDYGDEPF
jgi:single-strand DNA-binding protein